MSLPSDEDDQSYDDPTAEELAWQAVEARREEYYDECWESAFGEVLEDIRESALSDSDFSD